MSSEFQNLPEEFKNDYTEEDPRKAFHVFNRSGYPLKPIDQYIKDDIKQHTPLMIIGSIVYIYDKGVFRPDPQGVKLKDMIAKRIYPELVTSHRLRSIFDLFFMDAELSEDINTINDYPASWVNFKNGMFDPTTGELKPHDPRYKSINQIPHEYQKDQREGSMIDKWLNDISQDIDDQEMLLQYCGLCMNRDTRFQKSLFLTGEGGTGKSTVISFLSEIIGKDNLSSITLEQLNERFHPAQLFGKLCNTCADLRTSTLTETDGFKRITGEDLLMCERKGKDPFFFNSYAKLLFSVNEMPIVKGESTDGFYRRLLIIRMRKRPGDQDPKLLSKLRTEIPYFINLAMYGLRTLYENMKITESANSKEEVDKLRSYSDSVQGFLKECCDADPRRSDWKTDRVKLYSGYVDYCRKYQRQPMSNQNFYRSLEAKGYIFRKRSADRIYQGIVYPAVMGTQQSFRVDSLNPRNLIC